MRIPIHPISQLPANIRKMHIWDASRWPDVNTSHTETCRDFESTHGHPTPSSNAEATACICRLWHYSTVSLGFALLRFRLPNLSCTPWVVSESAVVAGRHLIPPLLSLSNLTRLLGSSLPWKLGVNGVKRWGPPHRDDPGCRVNLEHQGAPTISLDKSAEGNFTGLVSFLVSARQI
ncbi:hypothetical protein B0H12DRAFT_1163864 [Mycena haematopus]|nr:hypothetical protein B0H12DRAFT_1163864 [Mycena haematopus]